MAGNVIRDMIRIHTDSAGDRGGASTQTGGLQQASGRDNMGGEVGRTHQIWVGEETERRLKEDGRT